MKIIEHYRGEYLPREWTLTLSMRRKGMGVYLGEVHNSIMKSAGIG